VREAKATLGKEGLALTPARKNSPAQPLVVHHRHVARPEGVRHLEIVAAHNQPAGRQPSLGRVDNSPGGSCDGGRLAFCRSMDEPVLPLEDAGAAEAVSDARQGSR